VILLVELIPRVHDPVGDVAVVGEEEETFGVAVEPTHRVDPFPDLDDVHHRPAVAFVFRSRDIAARFVEDQIARPLCPEQLPIDLDLGASWIGFGAELGHHLPVDGHPSGRDESLRRPSRSDAARGENTL
jgi:hypothetical protein